jgi:hypothetical protein
LRCKEEENDAGEVGGGGHTHQKTRSPFLPNREERIFQIEKKIKLGVEVVPAGQPGAGLIIEKRQCGDKSKQEIERPVAS